ncbi:ATP-binding SpoIIE family protein phosphatase [Pantanalinema sp. GBBB05]|uniref:ATP-binding SpoIIE family protein phosphatase n=1 Tax=Pantanalinema sp. GBBB05 TaxID=2604139 RepID=UPI001D7A0A4A|nr:SpoIIE family protein phosphatase [Pantanalinema sp. GBBB05]
MTEPIALAIVDSSQAGEARRKAIALSRRLGFSEVEQGKVGLVVTEVANNLANHAVEGQLLLCALEQQGQAGLQILALDRGPGIRDIGLCLQDGFSTAGTPGNGLGAMQRLSDLFEIYSLPEQGTAILCQIWVGSTLPRSSAGLELGAVCLPKSGEEISGDSWSICALDQHRYLILVADGLGHGTLAAHASLEAVRVFQEQSHCPPADILATAHQALRSTRGAAIAIAAIDIDQQTVVYAGIGNIAGCLCTAEQSTSMVSHNGTIGHELRKIQAFNYSWSSDKLLIMHSDGLRTQWRLDHYPGLCNQHPSLIAGVLYRDFNRGRDDVTVLVAREVN